VIFTKEHLICFLIFTVPPSMWPAQHDCVMRQTTNTRTLDTATYKTHKHPDIDYINRISSPTKQCTQIFAFNITN